MRLFALVIVLSALVGCSHSNKRYPASRAGRGYQEPKVMNRHNVDTDTLYQGCLKEWPEIYCRNRMGR